MQNKIRSNKSSLIAIGFLLVLILLVGCSTLRESFREPKQFEAQNLVIDQGMTFLADTTVGVNRILLVKGENSFGYFVTTVREPEDELVWSSILTSLTEDPLNYIAVASGDPYIIGVWVQDQKLLESAESVQVSMSDGTQFEQPLSDQGAAVLQSSPEQGSQFVSISVIGSDGQAIYQLEP